MREVFFLSIKDTVTLKNILKGIVKEKKLKISVPTDAWFEMRAKKNIHLSGFEIGGMIARKCTFKKENHVGKVKQN